MGDQIRGYKHDKEKALQWGRQVYELVEDARGMGEAELFLSGDATSDAGDWLNLRLARLVKLMEKADNLELRPDFDPETWKGHFKGWVDRQ